MQMYCIGFSVFPFTVPLPLCTASVTASVITTIQAVRRSILSLDNLCLPMFSHDAL